MNADDQGYDDALRSRARRSLESSRRAVDHDRELDAFNSRLESEDALVRVEAASGSNDRTNRWWHVAAAAGVAVLLGIAGLAVTRDNGRRIGSPTTIVPSSSTASTPSTSSESARRDTTPRATTELSAFSVGGGFNILEYPKVGFADSKAELAELLAGAQPPVDIDELGVDWDRYGAVVFVRPTDLCPSVFGGVAISGDMLSPVFLNPGYEMCEEPLLSHTVIAAVDRDVLVDVERVELPAQPPYFSTAMSIPISATPASTPTSASPTIPEAVFGALRGSVSMPEVGEAALAALDDGSPIVVIRHHDTTISAIRPWSVSAEAGDSPRLVSWVGSTRTFLGAGAWDEYGRRLDGPRNTDLETYSTRVIGDLVEIGSAAATPAGSPIGSTTLPRTDDLTIRPDDTISLTDALALPAGQTRWIDTSLVIDPTGAHLCSTSGFAGSPDLAPCPSNAPEVAGVEATTDIRTVRFGPLLATRTDNGFTNIVPTGGYASSSFGEGLPPPVAP